MEHSRATDSATNFEEPAEGSLVDLANFCYAEELRAVGRALGAQKFISVELGVEGDGYRVRAEVDPSSNAKLSLGAFLKKFLADFGTLSQKKERPNARCIERRYSAEEIQKLIHDGVAKRLDPYAVPDPFSLSNIFRQAGAYLDSLDHATLISVLVKDRWMTIRYMDGSGQVKEWKQDVQFFYGYWVKMYLRRNGRSRPTLSKQHLA